MRKPNLILILADDMGIGDLSCYGAKKIMTPHMDAIARNGMRFTDAHATAAICTPSRYSIMTGRYCWKTPLHHSVLRGFAPPLIEKGRPTLASVLKRAGYRTAAVGKWHLGLEWTQKDGRTVPETVNGDIRALGYDGFAVDYSIPVTGGPRERGFDSWFGIAGSLDMPPYCFIENERTLGIPSREKETYYNQSRGLQVDGYREEEVDTTFADKAVARLEACAQDADIPFFLYLAAAAPHVPCNRRPGFVIGKTAAGDRGDMVYLFDWMVGQVTAAVRRLGLEDNTVIAVTSDNGAVSRCENGEDYGHRSNGRFRGYKRDVWEGGHREPLLIQWPGIIPAGTTCDRLVGLQDLFATFTEIAGGAIPPGAAEDSVSILPLLTAAQPRCACRRSLIHHSGNGMFSIRKDHWKLIDGLGSGGATEPLFLRPEPGEAAGQLYDSLNDPEESIDLWNRHPGVVAELMGELDREVCPYFDRKGIEVMRALDPRHGQRA